MSEPIPAPESAALSWKRRIIGERRLRYLTIAEETLKRFSPGERLVLYLLATLLSLSTLYLLSELNARVSVVVPTRGGQLIEGQTGPVRFINPLLAISVPDQDLTALVYSGLMRALPDGTMVPDLAHDYSVSADGRTYTFKLRPNATFHDGVKVTSADVLFTIQEALNQNINSARRADWTGVAVSAPDASTVVFTLPHAYAPFIGNTTLGILPKHLWQNVTPEEFPFSQINTHPIGSGPYKIEHVSTDSTGSALRYDLAPFRAYTLGSPFLSQISFVFFPSEDALIEALNTGTIDAAANVSPTDLAKLQRRTDLAAVEVHLPRVFGVFFNQSRQTVLSDPTVRAALEAAVDKSAIIANSLSGRGIELDGPIPPGLLGTPTPGTPRPIQASSSSITSSSTQAVFAQKARALLQQGGWTFDQVSGAWQKNKSTLSFTLSTADQPELVATAKALATAWRAAGINVSVQIYPIAQLNTSVIRPRAYDALLFGEVVGPELDLYAFWHSSQRNDPGLNLALYANAKTDALLSQARATTAKVQRDTLYRQFSELVIKDDPAIFLYAPDFVYVVPKNIEHIALGALTLPADRFANVYQWYTDTEYVWSVFAPPSVSKNY